MSPTWNRCTVLRFQANQICLFLTGSDLWIIIVLCLAYDFRRRFLWTYEPAISYYRFALVNYIGFMIKGCFLPVDVGISMENPTSLKHDIWREHARLGKIYTIDCWNTCVPGKELTVKRYRCCTKSIWAWCLVFSLWWRPFQNFRSCCCKYSVLWMVFRFWVKQFE